MIPSQVRVEMEVPKPRASLDTDQNKSDLSFKVEVGIVFLCAYHREFVVRFEVWVDALELLEYNPNH